MRHRLVVGLPALAAGMLLLAGPLSAQRGDPARPPRFDVVSIKQASIPADVLPRLLSLGGSCGLPAIERSGSLVTVPLGTVCGLIRVAYDVADYQVVGVPAELSRGEASNFLQIEARVEGGTTPSVADARLMLQTLLAERFGLRIHREPREIPVYALVAAKGGPRFTPCANPDAPSGYVAGRLVNCRPPLIPMARVAQMLVREAGRPVLDKTGLAPAAFELHWLPEGAPAQPDSPPALFTAIQEQLGLRLEAQRSPVDSIIVDHVERPTSN
jgi:uncharacterized protein (TIGR03435 family)